MKYFPFSFVSLVPILAAILLLSIPAISAQDFQLNFDDGRKLSELLRASGEIALSGNEAPENDGRALKVKTEGNFAFYTAPDVLKFNSENGDTISFQIFNPEGKKQRFDFIAIEPDRRAMFWKKVEFDHQGWKTFELPMEWFRWNRGRGPLWDNVNSIGLRGGAGLEFWIDDIQIKDAVANEGPELTPADVKGVAFPVTESVRSKTEGDVWVMTDSVDLDVDALHAHLTSVRNKLLDVLPMWKRPNGEFTPAMMIVTKDRAGYEGIFKRLGEKYAATLPVSQSGGYHVQGIGFSSYDPKFGTKRPVFTHEFTHSVASSVGRIDFAGRDWFQEGLASFVQARAHPQKGMGMMILTSLRDPDGHDALQKLTSGDPISARRYWQAMTLVDFLMNSPEMKPRFPELMKAIEESGSTNLSKHLEPVYEIEFSELQKKWADYVQNNLERFDRGIQKPE